MLVKKIIIKILVYTIAAVSIISGCTKDENESTKFSAGTYYGEKGIHYFSTNTYTRDTITIKFDSIKYLYSGSWSLDYGKGNYLISNDTIEFNDEYARITLYSWHWILFGKFKFELVDDFLILTKKQHNQLITCRLTKIAEQ